MNFDMDLENRIMDPAELPEDLGDSDNPLRPKILQDYIGQEIGRASCRERV